MGDVFKETAEKTAARIDKTAMALEYDVILAILNQLYPIIAGCFTRKNSPDPAYAAEKFREMYARNPHKLRKQLASRIRSQADEPMSKEQAVMLAEAIIQQMLETEDSVIQVACNEAPSDIPSDN